MRLLQACVLAIATASIVTACETSKSATTTPPTASQIGAAAVDEQRLLNADREPGAWMSIGRTYWEQRFSTLNQVNDKNVSTLGLAWYSDIDTERGQEATPLVVDGMMYLTTAWSLVKAYDVHTGKLVWEYDPKVDKARGLVACCDVVNRGVAAWNGKLFLGAFDGRLIALDAKTGKEVWTQQTFDPSVPQSITGAPRVIKGKVIIGQGGAEYHGRGYVSAYDAETGALDWRWYVVPGDPSKPYEQPELAEAAKTWKGDFYWKTGGGGTPWDGMAYDPELDTLYVGTGNGTPWNQSIRSPGGGDNLFLSSIVALDPNTGKYKWHYQTTPGESWDYTATQPIIIAELNYPTGKRKVVMEAPKNGFFYVLDAKDGKLISAEKYGPLTWATHVDMKTGRPVENPAARYDVTGKPVVIRPGALGMHNWYPMAFSPETGLVYIPVQVQNAPFSAVAAKDFKINPIGQGSNTGANFSTGQDICQAPDAKCGPVESYILAWDPVNAKEVWRAKNEAYGSTGIMATSGNLIFSGNHKGEFVAYNATTGERLWAAPTQARAIAAPSAFTVDGQEQIALLVGARGLPENATRTNPLSANNSRLLVFKLGGTASLPKTLPPGGVNARMKIDPPLLTAPTETVLAGEQAFAANCAVCHGANVVPGPGATAPDLRYSGILPLPFTWNLTVRDGDRAARGMPAFGTKLAKDTTDAILAYVIKRANDEKAIQEAAAKK